MRAWLTVAAMVAALSVATAACTADVVLHDFDYGDVSGWEPIAGKWRAQNGAYLQSDSSSHDYKYCVTGQPWAEGAIQADAVVVQSNPHGNVGSSFGLIVKFIDENTWCALRFGSYGACSLLIRGPESRVVRVGHCQPELNKTYHPKVILRNGLIAVSLDGIVTAILKDPLPDRPGRPGLFTETQCTFDNVRIQRWK